MSIIAKLAVSALKYHHGGSVEVTLETRYDDSIPEDKRFLKATPWGSFTMQVDNPAALEQLKNGQQFYALFVPVEDGIPVLASNDTDQGANDSGQQDGSAAAASPAETSQVTPAEGSDVSTGADNSSVDDASQPGGDNPDAPEDSNNAEVSGDA